MSAPEDTLDTSGDVTRHGYGPQHPRFPGFDVLAQQQAWDAVTRRAVLQRLQPAGEPRFFSQEEFGTVAALLDRLIGQGADEPRQVDVAAMVDIRMAEGSTDGWHFDDMPSDEEVWHRTAGGLDEDAEREHGVPFSECDPDQQNTLLTRIHDADANTTWHGLNAARLWNLWMRYACTAFYSHPAIWNEIGFNGPAYPRGYKNSHVGKREPFEVPDAMPLDDPHWNGAR